MQLLHQTAYYEANDKYYEMEKKDKNKKILMASGNSAERFLLSEIFSQLNAKLAVDVVYDFRRLHKRLYSLMARYSLPALIILDYELLRDNTPRLIASVKNDDNLNAIPLCVLGGTDSKEQWPECLAAGALKCFVKPARPSEWKSLGNELIHLLGLDG